MHTNRRAIVRTVAFAMLGVLAVACGAGSDSAADGGGSGLSVAVDSAVTEYGDDVGTDEEGTVENTLLPAACEPGDSVVTAWGGGDHPTRGDELNVVSTFAQGRYIAPNAAGLGSAESLPHREAAVELGFESYVIWITDFPMDDHAMAEVFLVPDATPTGGTRATVQVLPPTLEPLRAGDVVEVGDREWESATTFPSTLYGMVESDTRSMSANVISSGEGRVEILALDHDTLCVEVDYTGFDFVGNEVVRLAGTVVAPLVHGDGVDAVFT